MSTIHDHNMQDGKEEIILHVEIMFGAASYVYVYGQYYFVAASFLSQMMLYNEHFVLTPLDVVMNSFFDRTYHHKRGAPTICVHISTVIRLFAAHDAYLLEQLFRFATEMSVIKLVEIKCPTGNR